jgi:TPR repeat
MGVLVKNNYIEPNKKSRGVNDMRYKKKSCLIIIFFCFFIIFRHTSYIQLQMSKTLLVLLFTTQIFAQTLKQKITGDWIKEDIRLKDGSPILLDEVKNMQLRYIFTENNEFQITINGKTGKGKYKILGDTIQLNKTTFLKVLEVEDTKLVIQEVNTDPLAPPSKSKIIFIAARIHNLGYVPEKYRTKGKDTIYVSKQNYLEPFFVDNYNSAAQVISNNFYFPEHKAGDFYSRFIITKTGEIKGIEILSSTDEKYNNYLIKAIKSTKDKWFPATWEGQPVNTEIKMDFDMGWSEKMAKKNKSEILKDTIDANESNYYLLQANINMEQKRYTAAIKNLSKSLDLDPRNIDAYYARAAVYALTKDTQKMCVDLLQLKHLEQAKGTEFWKKFCDLKKKIE